ncbi:MAG TPA: hypothetical protein VEU29_06815 [Actinomycetota bacterium]|nr:hypothetical protein [Actinomycetota bacterium]
MARPVRRGIAQEWGSASFRWYADRWTTSSVTRSTVGAASTYLLSDRP